MNKILAQIIAAACFVLLILFTWTITKQSEQQGILYRYAAYQYIILPEYHKPDSVNIPCFANNPGNITLGNPAFDSLAIGVLKSKDHTFLVFADTSVGWGVLRNRIKLSESQTLHYFITVYGGSYYLKYLCAALNCKPTERVKNLDQELIARVIATHEGWIQGTKTEFLRIK